ncbi:MAG TPA: hypothetical protein VFQ25_08920 [Ktedonobacterales bacterium]|nr:hypothetical protein [Ktedonobacterales bacterium]
MGNTDFTAGMIVLVVLVSALSGVMALLGLFLAYIGFAQTRDPQGGFSWGQRQRAKILHQWIPSLGWAAPGLQIDLFNQVTRLQGWAVCGAGAGFAAGGVGMGALTLALSGFNAAGALAGLVILMVPCVTLPATLGMALGFRFGARAANRVQQAAAATLWEPRRVRDYRAAWLDWALALMSLTITAVCATIAMRFPHLTIPHLFDEPAPSALPPLTIGAAAAMLGPLVSWLSARWIATAPLAISTPYAGVANDAEDFVRAQVSASVFLFAWRSTGWLMMALAIAGTMVMPALPVDDMGLVTQFLTLGLIFLLIGFIVTAAGAIAGLLGGRLGGRRAGWPWRPRVMGLQAA